MSTNTAPSAAARPLTSPSWPVLALGLALVLALGIGCPCVRGPVNSSPGLRWWLFSHFGADRVCPEMLKRGAPLKLDPNGNVVGRFFPATCQAQVNDSSQTVSITFSGTGFSWTPFAGRVWFSVNASVEYRMDFYLAEDATYVWAKVNRVLMPPAFTVTRVENPIVDWATRTPVGYLANTFGTQLLASQLANGFTVVRSDEGDDFTLGQLSPPARPRKPFGTSEEHYAFANETTEVRPEQVDIAGPFEVLGEEQALFLTWRVLGPRVDVFLMARGAGDLWRNGLAMGAPLGPPQNPPLASWVIEPGYDQRQKINVFPGQYYLVFDNSSRLGSANPPWNPLGVIGANTSTVSYTAALGDQDDSF